MAEKKEKEKNYHFFAFMARLKLTHRWGLMKSIQEENVAEHTTQVAQIAHALAVIRNKCFGGQLDPGKVAVLALYHESGEVLTGDLPTPIKYYNEEIKGAYKAIEARAETKLLGTLPEELREEYEPLVHAPVDTYEHILVKAADKLAAYIKCLEELRLGNKEFSRAARSLEREVAQYRKYEEVNWFCERFLDSFSLTLDEME